MILKRTFDFLASLFGLLILSPLLLACMFLVWRQDGYSPFYIAERVGINGKTFKMIKLRSMVKCADRSGVDSTAADDARITKVGHIIRKYKVDEIPQLFNVLKGDMSIVGPRPNIQKAVEGYSVMERGLLHVKPGITDISSIVFSDEGEILKGKENPDEAYDQLIRPWKSKLGLFYIENVTFLVDLKIIYLTFISFLSRRKVLNGVFCLLSSLNAPHDLRNISQRKDPL